MATSQVAMQANHWSHHKHGVFPQNAPQNVSKLRNPTASLGLGMSHGTTYDLPPNKCILGWPTHSLAQPHPQAMPMHQKWVLGCGGQFLALLHWSSVGKELTAGT